MRTLRAVPAGADRRPDGRCPGPRCHAVTRVCHEIVTVGCKFGCARVGVHVSNG